MDDDIVHIASNKLKLRKIKTTLIKGIMQNMEFGYEFKDIRNFYLRNGLGHLSPSPFPNLLFGKSLV